MSEYRRNWQDGGVYFFTLITEARSRFLTDPIARQALREAIIDCRNEHPFSIDAWVLLPDHLHAIWALPAGDCNYHERWMKIKRGFTRRWIAAGGIERSISEAKQHDRRRGVWQRRYWEHTIRDERDWENHLNYIHFNPVKHGLVTYPKDWRFSTFRRWVADGVYSLDWACGPAIAAKMDELSEITGE